MTTDTPCTPEDRLGVFLAAQRRLQYIAWLAKQLEMQDHEFWKLSQFVRREAASQLRQLAGIEQ